MSAIRNLFKDFDPAPCEREAWFKVDENNKTYPVCPLSMAACALGFKANEDDHYSAEDELDKFLDAKGINGSVRQEFIDTWDSYPIVIATAEDKKKYLEKAIEAAEYMEIHGEPMEDAELEEPDDLDMLPW